jgi:hypothetical protein
VLHRRVLHRNVWHVQCRSDEASYRTSSYDFLGLVEVSLPGKWNEYRNSFGDKAESVPTHFFGSQELIEGSDGKLSPNSRLVCSNRYGMLAPMLQTGGRLLPPASTQRDGRTVPRHSHGAALQRTVVQTITNLIDRAKMGPDCRTFAMCTSFAAPSRWKNRRVPRVTYSPNL